MIKISKADPLRKSAELTVTPKIEKPMKKKRKHKSLSIRLNKDLPLQIS